MGAYFFETLHVESSATASLQVGMYFEATARGLSTAGLQSADGFFSPSAISTTVQTAAALTISARLAATVHSSASAGLYLYNGDNALAASAVAGATIGAEFNTLSGYAFSGSYFDSYGAEINALAAGDLTVGAMLTATACSSSWASWDNDAPWMGTASSGVLATGDLYTGIALVGAPCASRASAIIVLNYLPGAALSVETTLSGVLGDTTGMGLAVAVCHAAGAGGLSTLGRIVAWPASQSSAVGRLTTAIAMQGGVVGGGVVQSAVLSEVSQVQAAIGGASAATGALSTGIPLGVSVTSVVGASAEVSTGVNLQGFVAVEGTGDAGLMCQARFSASASAAGVLAAWLKTDFRMAGSGFGCAVLSADMVTGISCAGLLQAAAIVRASISTGVQCAAVVQGGAGAVADLLIDKPLLGAGVSSVLCSAGLRPGVAALRGKGGASARVQAGLSTGIQLGGRIFVQSRCAADPLDVLEQITPVARAPQVWVLAGAPKQIHAFTEGRGSPTVIL